jgi:hypothetical protein
LRFVKLEHCLFQNILPLICVVDLVDVAVVIVDVLVADDFYYNCICDNKNIC